MSFGKVLSFFKVFFENKVSYFLFFGSFFLYFCLGFYFQYNSESIFQILDLIFNMDMSLVYSSLFNSDDFFHLRNFAHPFFTNLLYPISFLFEKILFSQKIGAIFMQAFFGSSVVVVLYKTFLNFTNKRYHSFLLILLYLLSFSTMVFSSFIESYIYSAFFNVLNLYYISLIYKQEDLSKQNLFVLSFLSFCSFAIVTANLIPNLIMIFFLILKIYKKKTQLFKQFAKILLIILFLFASFSVLAHFSYENKTQIPDQFEFEQRQLTSEFNIQTVKTVFTKMFVGSFYFLNSNFLEKILLLLVEEQPAFGLYVPATLFYLFVLFGLIQYFKEDKKNEVLIPLSIILIINIFEYLVYCSSGVFLFSQNFLPYLMLILLILFSNISCKKLIVPLLTYLIFILIRNYEGFSVIQSFLSWYYEENFDISLAILFSILFSIILIFLSLTAIFLKKMFFSKISLDKLIFNGLKVYLAYVFLFGIVMSFLRY